MSNATAEVFTGWRCKSCHYPVDFNKKIYAYCSMCGGDFEKVEREEVSSVPKMKVIPICAACGISICEVCNVCEEVGCSAVGQKLTTRVELVAAGLLKPRTQKALGYQVLGRTTLTMPTPFALIGEEGDIDSLPNKVINYFARPCPKRPRHGFVESRSVMAYDRATIKQILKEAQAADPEAELLLCPYVPSAKANAVIMPTGISVGPGNDGATAGRNSVYLPLMGVPFAELNSDILEAANIGVDSDPYVEAVKDGATGYWMFTQLRAGPKLSGSEQDYIPHPVKVEAVIVASGDLLEWEKQTAELAPGTVVVHKDGSLISHYGVHCIINKVPILTSRIPMVGEWLEPTKEIRDPDPQSVVEGLSIGAGLDITQDPYNTLPNKYLPADLIKLMLVTLHNAPAMSNGNGVWLGIAAAVMFRTGMAASHGEARHGAPKLMNTSRDTVYTSSFRSMFDWRSRLGMAQWYFLNASWKEGYGGEPWGKCTAALIDLDTAIQQLIRTPDAEHVKVLTSELNAAVNQAHNNGWWLNKFIGDDTPFQQASVQSLKVIVEAGKAALDLAPAMRDRSLTLAEKWGSEPAVEVTAPIDSEEVLRAKRKEDGKGCPECGQCIAGCCSKDGICHNSNCTESPDYEFPAEDEEEPAKSPFEPAAEKAEGHGVDSSSSMCGCKYCKHIEEIPSAALVSKEYTISTLPLKSAKIAPKLNKISYNPAMHKIVAAHVRYESESGGKVLTAHLQFKLDAIGTTGTLLKAGIGYFSRTYTWVSLSKETAEALVKISNGPFSEVSYSSSAGGYLPLEVASEISFWEPHADMHLKFTYPEFYLQQADLGYEVLKLIVDSSK